MLKQGIIVFSIIAGTISAETTNNSGYWPCYHGPLRNNISAEKGLLASWPKDGPKLLWTASGLGHGYSSVAVAGGRIFSAGMSGKDTFVIALDPNGKVLWRRKNGESWQASEDQSWAVSYAGSRGTPTIDGDSVYHLSELGRLTAFDAASGKELWHRDSISEFKAPKPKYGYCESVLVLGNRVFFCPGGTEGYVVALDKKSGKTIWSNKSFDDPIGYSALVPAAIGDIGQLIGLSAKRIFAVDPGNGKLLWQYAFGNERNNSATDVIVHDDQVYASSGYGKGSVLLQPVRQADGIWTVKSVWTSELLDNHHGGVILVDGYVYGAGQEAKGWTCLNITDGQKLWQSPGKGSLTYADGRLYCLDETGRMTLVEPAKEGWKKISEFSVPRGGQGAYWAHPVVCGGRLYIRHSDTLYAYAIKLVEESAGNVKTSDDVPLESEKPSEPDKQDTSLRGHGKLFEAISSFTAQLADGFNWHDLDTMIVVSLRVRVL